MKHGQYRHGVLLLIFGCVGVLQASRVSKEFRKSVPFRPEGNVAVKNVNGMISVEPWDRDSVEVYAEIEVKAGSHREAEAFMEKVEILVDHQDDRLSVETDYPKVRGGDGFWDWVFGGKKPQVKVDFWVKVPAKTDLRLKSVNGRVQVRDVEGRANLGTTNGGIGAEGVRGAVDAHTVNGGIRVELTTFNPDEEMSFSTTNGAIEITLPWDVQADLKASTVNGRISTDFPVEVSGGFIGKKLRGRINGGGGLIDLHTVNGSIRIYEE